MTMTMTELLAAAQIGVTVDGQLILSANTELADGSKIYCSLRYRSANSRGANRGRGLNVEFNYKTVDQKYSKRISKDRAIELLKAN